MMIGRVTGSRTSGELVVQLIGAGSYEVLCRHAAIVPRVEGGPVILTAPQAGDLVALDEIKGEPGAHVIVARLGS